MRSTLLVLLAAMWGGLSGGASAQGQADADRQTILDYQLSMPRARQLIPAMEAMTKYIVSLPDAQTRLVKTMKMTLTERRAQLEGDPKAMAILKQNGLTAQEYLVGVPALRMALMAAQGMTGPHIVASPANVAFAKANLAELKPMVDAADGMGQRK